MAKILTAAELAPSNKEAHRLLTQGAVSVDGEKVTDPRLVLAARTEPYLFKVGKRRFAKVRVT
jgi:tyrosyl-tRNA synthetase